MRQFNVSDVFTVVDLLSVTVKTGRTELQNILKASGAVATDETTAEELGGTLVLFVLNNCYSACRDKLIEWLASLHEMPLSEFMKLPPETVLDTIEEIATRKDAKDFFARAYLLFKQIGASGKATSGG